MATELIVLMFLRAQVAAAGAILLILALRLPARRLIGAELGYRLWAAAPIAAMASLIPTLPEFLDPRDTGAGLLIRTALPGMWTPVAHHAAILALLWASGAVVPAILFLAAHHRFRRLARAGLAGPAVTGAWPHMVVPRDYRMRFTEAERVLIRAHEREHMGRRHPTANLIVALLQVVSWFNPLVHLAAGFARLDQELACDAAVMARYPKRRRDYARTLVKAHAAGAGSPFACALAAHRRHPLELRVAMLAEPRISLRRDAIGVFAVGALAVGLAVTLWGLAPL